MTWMYPKNGVGLGQKGNLFILSDTLNVSPFSIFADNASNFVIRFFVE